MQDLEKIFIQTFSDKKFSKGEKSALALLLQNIDEPTRHKLKHKVFELAKNELKAFTSLEVVNWIEEAIKLLDTKKESRSTDKVYFSPGEDCLQAILYALGRAITSVKICVFTISDDRISDEIIFCHKRGIKVQILSDNEKLYDTGSDIERLARAGIPVRIDRTSDHMHHKFAVIDQKVLITGSYNWTRSAAKYNHENVVITENVQVVEPFIKEFERLWTCMQAY